jgi:ssDNA-binding Zn-finger/Zn-ribbon topoisomerase 1
LLVWYGYIDIYSLQKQLNSIEEKLSWVTKPEYKQKLMDLCNRFTIGLEALKQPLNDKISFLENNIDVVESFPEFEWKSHAHGGTCPACGKKELFVPLQGQAKSLKCSRENACGYSSSIYSYLKEYKNMTIKEALEELASLGGIDLKAYETSLEVHTINQPINYKLEKKIREHNEISHEIIYTNFDSQKKYENVDYVNLLSKYENMSDKQKFMMIVTAIYKFSLLTNQQNKYNYYKSRAISAIKHPALLSKIKRIKDEIGFIHYQNDMDNLVTHLCSLFPIDDLIMFGIVNDDKHKFAHSFKHFSLEGFCVIPSFDLYSNMVTGLKLRNTKLADWQDENMKEPELSFRRIASPLPYGLTRDALLDEKAVLRLFEGSVDSFSIPSLPNRYDIAIAGVNGLSKEDFGLFRNKKVEIWFDQDDAGQKTAFGTKTITVSFSNTELSNWSFYVKFENFSKENKNITFSKKGEITTIKIEVINSDLYLKTLNMYLELITKKGFEYKETCKKGMKDLILDAGALDVIVKTWNIELGSDVNEVLKNNNIENF